MHERTAGRVRSSTTHTKTHTAPLYHEAFVGVLIKTDVQSPASKLTKTDDCLSACHSGGAASPAAARLGDELSQQEMKGVGLRNSKAEVHGHHLGHVDSKDV